MGNTTNYMIIMMSIYLITGLMALGIYSVNPSSNYLAGNYIFNINNNQLGNQTSVVGGQRFYNFSYQSSGLSGLSSESSSTVAGNDGTFKYPDWVRSANTWFNGVSAPVIMITSFVASPYTLLAHMNVPKDVAILLGVFFGCLSTLILANWLFGRDT